ncbi:MAG: hypothetical protein AAF125_22760 [Chloroflexota bacterium]
MADIQYPITPEAKSAARKLVAAWDDGTIPQTVLFGHYTQGKISYPMFFDLQGNTINYDDAPERGQLFEYAHFNLVSLRTFRDASTLEVILLQALRDAVATDFRVSEYFLTLNAAGVVNMTGGTVNITDAATKLTAPNTSPLYEDSELVPTLYRVLDDLPGQRDDLDTALTKLGAAEPNERSDHIPTVIAALGRALNDGDGQDPRIMEAVSLLTRHMGGV